MSATQQDNHRFSGHANDLASTEIPVRTSSAPPNEMLDPNRPIYTPYRSGGGYAQGHTHTSHLQHHARPFVPPATPPAGVFQPGQPFVPRGAPAPSNQHHTSHEQGHPPSVSANAPPHIPGQPNVPGHTAHARGPSMRGPPRVNPNVASFVPQSLQPQQPYIPRNTQQHAPYYPHMQGYMQNVQPMYMPHPNSYAGMQHPMPMGHNVGIPHQNVPVATPPQPAVVPREKKALLIIDPKTNKPIDVCKNKAIPAEQDKSTPSTPLKKPAVVSVLRASSAEFVLPSRVASPKPPTQTATPEIAPPANISSPRKTIPVENKTKSPDQPTTPAKAHPASPTKTKAHPASPAKAKAHPASPAKIKAPPASPMNTKAPPTVASPILSPKAINPVSPKSKTPIQSPKNAEPSLVFGTVEITPEAVHLSPKSVTLPPGFEEKIEEEAAVEEEVKILPKKRTAPRPLNPTPLRNGKSCYSIEFLLSFREEYIELPSVALEPNSGWLSMEVINEGPSGRSGRRVDRQNSSGGPPTGQLQRQSSRGNNDKNKQWGRDQQIPRRGNTGGRGGKGGRPPQASLDDVPLKRREDRWVPVKATSNLEKITKQVQSIMNKMTNQKFKVLSGQLVEIDMESMDILSAVITIIFDKALGEPHFCEMYANLCVVLEQHWKVWSFLQLVQNDDVQKWFWTTMSDTDVEVVGPFKNEEELFENASEDPDPDMILSAPDNIKLKEIRVRGGKFIKVWHVNNELYWSGQSLEDMNDLELNGPFDTREHANVNSVRTTSFKRILLNACQEEFEKDNIYEELDILHKKAKEDGTLTSEMEASYEEKKMLTKRRMLGNIRFIGELYRKGMLQERIMHECIMKLMDVTNLPQSNDEIQEFKLIPLHPNTPPDEESIESLSKLLTTMGKDLEAQSAYPGAMSSYFQHLGFLTKDKRLSSRINFMILDVIDLRNNRWVPRRKELVQKTLEEIRKDADRELAGGSQKRNNPPSRGGVVSSTSARENNSGRGNNFRSGSSQTQSRNNFNFDRSRSQQIEKPQSGRPASFNNFKGKSTKQIIQKPIVLKIQKQIETNLSQISQENKDLISKKSKSILEEYVELKDVKELVSCFDELKNELSSVVPLLISSHFTREALKKAVELKDIIREGMFQGLLKLVEEKAIEMDALQYGLEGCILFASELSYDVPKIHEHLGRIIAQFSPLAPGLSLTWLVSGFDLPSGDEMYEELVDSGVLSGIVGVYLNHLAPNIACAQASIAFVSSNLSCILPSHGRDLNGIIEWINKFHLAPILPALKKSCDIITIVKESKDVDDVITWIENHVSGEMRSDSLFAKQTCLFLLSLSNWSIPSQQHLTLLVGLCGNHDGQVAFLSGIVQEISGEKLKPLIQNLLKEHVISDKALWSWRESVRGTSKENILTHVNDLFEKGRK